MNEKTQRHSIGGLFTLILLLLFAFSTLSLVLLGSRIYRNGVAHLDRNYTTRTAVAYVTEKIRQHDESGCISFAELADIPSLLLEDTIDGDAFLTYIYFYDGALRELFVRSSTAPSPEMGNKIVALDDFSVSLSPDTDDVILVLATGEDGNTLEAAVHPTTGVATRP